MPNYRLSELAKQDLIRIAQFGDERFGIKQSDAYREQLKEKFDEIAEAPQHYPEVIHIKEGYRRSVCGSHSIYYRMNGIVEIMRLLGREEPIGALLE